MTVGPSCLGRPLANSGNTSQALAVKRLGQPPDDRCVALPCSTSRCTQRLPLTLASQLARSAARLVSWSARSRSSGVCIEMPIHQPSMLVSLNRPSAVESERRGGGQTGRCSLVAAGVMEPVTEYRTHGRRAGLREARTVTRAKLERACTSKGSEDHVCYLNDGGHRRSQGAHRCLCAGAQERGPAVYQRC